jgi:hypothetical protein
LKQLADVLEQLFEEVVPIKESRRWELQQCWRATFASHVEAWTGPLQDHCWHALSYGLLPSYRGANASYAFEERMRGGAVLLATTEPSLSPTYRVVSTRPLTYAELSAAWMGDLYLISEDWSWSFVMTHEGASLGPFFSKTDAADAT